jgi:hypothetical protein
MTKEQITNKPIPNAMVTIEKKLFAPSVVEMVYLTIMMLVLLNGFILLLFPLILRLSYLETFKKSWIILLFVPILTGIMQPLTNRDGLLILKGIMDQQALQLKLAEALKHFDYLETGRDEQSLFLDYGSKWKRFMHFYKGQVTISVVQDEIHLSGKKQILDFLETKMLFCKDFQALNAHKLK